MFEVCFQYDKQISNWEVIVKGAASEVEAVQGFNAVILTMRQVTPTIEANEATHLHTDQYKISVGI